MRLSQHSSVAFALFALSLVWIPSSHASLLGEVEYDLPGQAKGPSSSSSSGNATNSSSSSSSQDSSGSGSNGNAMAREDENPTARLFNTLLTIVIGVFLGYSCVRLKFIRPENGDLSAFGFFIGQLVFPILIFKTVATAKLGSIDWGVLLACSFGKALMMLLTWLATFFCYQPSSSRPQRFLNATVFASFVMATNDFAIGMPVVMALYGSQAQVNVYIQGNALVGSLIFVPSIMVLFTVGTTMKKRLAARSERDVESNARDSEDSQDSTPGASPSGAESSSASGCLSASGQLLLDLVKNPVIFMTLVGLLMKAVPGILLEQDGELQFVGPIQNTVELIASPFSMCALFLTGTSLKSFHVTVVPVLLVLVKVVASAFVTQWIAKGLTEGGMMTNFCFLYGMIPTSSAPLIFSTTFAPESAELVATGILLGLILSGPLLIALESATLNLADTLVTVHFTTCVVGLALGVMMVIVIGVLRSDFGYRCPMKAVTALYAILLLGYEAMMFLVSPELSEAFCRNYNEAMGMTPASHLLGWLQHGCTMLIFCLKLLDTLRGYGCFGKQNAVSWGWAGFFTLLSLGIAVVPALLSVPSTANEMCSETQPPIGKVALSANCLWTATCMLITLIFIIVDCCPWRWCMRCNGKGTDEASPDGQSSEVSDEEISVEALPSELTSDQQDSEVSNSSAEGYRLQHTNTIVSEDGIHPRTKAQRRRDRLMSRRMYENAKKNWQDASMSGVAKGLFWCQAVIRLMQLANTTQIMRKQTVDSSLAVLLLLEHTLVMLQPLVLLALLLNQSAFASLLPAAFSRKIFCGTTALKRTQTMRGF
mmetsp:Transcript_1779/g.3997  ORF Transcript_1779/g.3997 Transcript_1779/m.3997 type:complete len:823 (-) Transcript_1779:344-2812(-)